MSERASAGRSRPVPERDASLLRQLRDDKLWQQLALLCAQLERRGYSLAEIGRVLGVSRAMIHKRVSRVDPAMLLGIEPDPEPVDLVRRSPRRRPRHRKVQVLHPETVTQLRDLAAVAGNRRAGQPEDHPAQQAARELNALLFSLYHGDDVALQVLADALEVTPAAVRFRLRAHEAAQAVPA